MRFESTPSRKCAPASTATPAWCCTAAGPYPARSPTGPVSTNDFSSPPHQRPTSIGQRTEVAGRALRTALALDAPLFLGKGCLIGQQLDAQDLELVAALYHQTGNPHFADRAEAQAGLQGKARVDPGDFAGQYIERDAREGNAETGVDADETAG